MKSAILCPRLKVLWHMFVVVLIVLLVFSLLPSPCHLANMMCRQCHRLHWDGLKLVWAVTASFRGDSAMIHFRFHLPLQGLDFITLPPFLFSGLHGNRAMMRGAKGSTGGEQRMSGLLLVLFMKIFSLNPERTEQIMWLTVCSQSKGKVTFPTL